MSEKLTVYLERDDYMEYIEDVKTILEERSMRDCNFGDREYQIKIGDCNYIDCKDEAVGTSVLREIFDVMGIPGNECDLKD